MSRLPWLDRLHAARLALAGDGVELLSYLTGARALTRSEAERVADIVVGQVVQPIAGLQQDLDRLADAVSLIGVRVEAAQRGIEERIVTLEQRPPCALMIGAHAAD